MKTPRTLTRSSITTSLQTLGKKGLAVIDQYPMQSFLAILGVLLVLIVVGNILRAPNPTDQETEKPAKLVTLYGIGTAPTMMMQAKIEKSGALNMSAQAAGFVQNIRKTEGMKVNKGEQLLSLSTTVRGGNISSVSRVIAQKNAELTEANYPLQQEMIAKRRDVANAIDAQADQLQDITRQSLDDTKTMIKLNEEILAGIDEQLRVLEATNINATNSAAIQQTKQAKVGVMSGLSALRNGLRNSEYQINSEEEPTRLSNLTKDLTLKQLEVEHKALDLGREISKLQLNIAYMTESLMYPAAPCTGVIERIYVSQGQVVAPGMPIASLSCAQNTTTAVLAVSSELATRISRYEKSTFRIGEKTFSLAARSISSEPTEGTLHSVLYTFPEEYENLVSDGSYVTIFVPVGTMNTSSTVPFIPLDSLYQTERDGYVTVAVERDGQLVAEMRKVSVGSVYGSFVEVTSGLSHGDRVIMDRSVISGDHVRTE